MSIETRFEIQSDNLHGSSHDSENLDPEEHELTLGSEAILSCKGIQSLLRIILKNESTADTQDITDSIFTLDDYR